VAALAVCAALTSAVAAEPASAGPSATETFAFETHEARLVLDAAGCARSLVRLADGRELLRDARTPFALVRVGGREQQATGIAREGDHLRIAFGDLPVTVALRIAGRGAFLDVAVEAIDGGPVATLELVRLPVAIDAAVGSTLAVRSDASVAVSLVGGSENVETAANHGGLLIGAVHADPALAPARVALLVTPIARFDEAMEEVEHALGLPSPRLGGRWAKASDAARRSYLFIDLTRRNAEEVMRWAKLGGFAAVLVYASTWAESPGSYRVAEERFPGGDAGLADVAARLHAAGLGFGLHVLTGLVGKRDPLASPRPGPGLLADARAALGADVGPDDREIPLAGAALDFPGAESTPGNVKAGRDVRIGDEVVRYAAIERAADGALARLVGCERGANGTSRARHARGSPAEHLAERYGSYLVDLRGPLVDVVAGRVAGLLDRVGADLVYLDAGEVNDANGPAWYWVGRLQSAILARVARPLLVQGSGMTAWTWHWFARQTCDDAVAVGANAWLDAWKIGRSLAAHRRDRIPAELGWWALNADSVRHPATTMAEVDHLGVRSVAYDVPFSVETRVASLRDHPAAEEILRRLGRYEEIRVTGRVPAGVRATLSVGEWRLADGPSAEPTFVPAAADVASAGTATSASDAAGARGAAAEPGGWLVVGDAGSALTVPRQDAVVTGALAVRLPVSPPSAIARWLLRPPVSRPLFVTLDVEGPAVAESAAPPILNVQLEAPGPCYRDYLVDLDFRGRRTLAIAPSADRVVRDASPAARTYSLKASLVDCDLSNARAANLRWMRGALGSDVTVRILRIG